MTRKWLYVTLAIVALCGSMRSLAASSDEEQLREIQQRLTRAWVQGDRSFIESVLAPEWRVTQADGSILSRAAVIDMAFVSKTLTVTSSAVDDVTVDLFGSTAVVRGRTVASGIVNATPVSARIRFTDTFIKRHGKWQAVASHASPDARSVP